MPDLPMRMSLWLTIVIGASFIICGGSPAQAGVQDEIQVYTDDIAKPGETTLDVHVNGTPSGVGPTFPREVTTNHAVRITPEFGYGLSRDWEFGLYLPLLQLGGQNGFDVVGVKARLKYLPIQPGKDGLGWYAGANLELSRVDRRFSQSEWGSELRPIVGYKTAEWYVAFNPILDWDLSGPTASAEPTFVPSLKVMRNLDKNLALGVEYYSNMGPIGHVLPWDKQDNRLYAVLDYDMEPYNFNLGIGRGLTESSDAWTIKAIFNVPLQSHVK